MEKIKHIKGLKHLTQFLVHSKYLTYLLWSTQYSERVGSIPASHSVGLAYNLNHTAISGIERGTQEEGGREGEVVNR